MTYPVSKNTYENKSDISTDTAQQIPKNKYLPQQPYSSTILSMSNQDKELSNYQVPRGNISEPQSQSYAARRNSSTTVPHQPNNAQQPQDLKPSDPRPPASEKSTSKKIKEFAATGIRKMHFKRRGGTQLRATVIIPSQTRNDFIENQTKKGNESSMESKLNRAIEDSNSNQRFKKKFSGLPLPFSKKREEETKNKPGLKSFSLQEFTYEAWDSALMVKQPKELFREDGAYSKMIKNHLNNNCNQWIESIIDSDLKKCLKNHAGATEKYSEDSDLYENKKDAAADELLKLILNNIHKSIKPGNRAPMPEECYSILNYMNKIAMERFPNLDLETTRGIVFNVFVFRYLISRLEPEQVLETPISYYMEIQQGIMKKLSDTPACPEFLMPLFIYVPPIK
jgi:hypothetical protein